MEVDIPAPLEGKRDGSVSASEFKVWWKDLSPLKRILLTPRPALGQSEEMLARLEPIAKKLREEMIDPSSTRTSLAQLLMQFLQFMEDVAGKNVSSMDVCKSSPDDLLDLLHAGNLQGPAKDPCQGSQVPLGPGLDLPSGVQAF